MKKSPCFSDTGELFDFAYKSEQLKKMLIEEIKDIIHCMKEALYTQPYDILFGRLHIRKRKDCYQEANRKFPQSFQKEINANFYEGLDIGTLQYHKTKIQIIEIMFFSMPNN
ncbi:hypothetical protein M9Y10_044592 [Tritrichomonas musculus]|uniref:Uncharacterized protein n=1 Tax=Tritrichomonas musculus TaxID=1915356 RepID=A0ABR2JSS8_9EUKA